MAELVVEILGGLLSGAVGWTLGWVVYVLVRLGRRGLLRADRAVEVVDASGATWRVRVALAPEPLRFRLATGVLAMSPDQRRRRRARGLPPDGVDDEELAHPSRLLDATDEAAGIVAPILIVVALVLAVVLLLEAAVVVLVAVLVLVVRTALGRWCVEVTAPGGTRDRSTVGTLAAARRERDRRVATLGAGRRVA